MQRHVFRGLGFFAFQILALAAAAIWWIPSWRIVEALSIVVFCLASLFLGIQFWRKLNLMIPKEGRSKSTKWMLGVGMVGMGLEWLVAALFSIVITTQLPFPPEFDHSQELPQNNTTIYIYDNSFLDPYTIVRERISWTPFTKKVAGFGAMASEVNFEEEGDWITWGNNKINLVNGETIFW